VQKSIITIFFFLHPPLSSLSLSESYSLSAQQQQQQEHKNKTLLTTPITNNHDNNDSITIMTGAAQPSLTII